MKLIYIVNVRIPTKRAHGYQICKMCEEFSNAGVKVELWIPERTNNIKEDIFSFYGIRKNFKIKKIKSFDFLRLEKYLGKFSFWLQSLFFLIHSQFNKVSKETIIYTRNFEIAWIFNLRGYKTVLETHSWPESKTWLAKYLVKKTNKIIAITRSVKEKYLNYGFEENNFLVAPDGVDLKKFDINLAKSEAREKLNLPSDKKIIIYTGHLYEWKGTQILAEAADFLEEDNIIVFVGGTREDIKKFRQRNEKYKNILIIGHVKHELIPLYLKAADVLVLPNSGREKISKHYTSPLKMFEYMASKRPIVSSDLPSIIEILNSGNAVLVKPDNPQDLADGIKKVLRDKELSNRIIAKAFNDVKSYTWQKRTEKIINFI